MRDAKDERVADASAPGEACKGGGNCTQCQSARALAAIVAHAPGGERSAGCAGPQLTRTTSTRLSENVGARPKPDHASEEIELTEPSERLSERQ